MTQAARLCRRCILPENFPGIRMDGDGLCSLCKLAPSLPEFRQTRQRLRTQMEGVLEHAKRSISPDRLKKTSKCTVCGTETQTNGDEVLCWVCRRLKVSAWRDIEQQMPAQE